MLTPLVVVVIDKCFNCGNQLIIGCELVEIVHLTFQNPLEAFHWAVINTSADTGHTLLHSLLVQFGFEYFACILEPTVTVK